MVSKSELWPDAKRRVKDHVEGNRKLEIWGPHVVEIYDQFQWEDGNDKTLTLKNFLRYYNLIVTWIQWGTRVTSILELPYQDPFDSFLTDLKTRNLWSRIRPHDKTWQFNNHVYRKKCNQVWKSKMISEIDRERICSCCGESNLFIIQ